MLEYKQCSFDMGSGSGEGEKGGYFLVSTKSKEKEKKCTRACLMVEATSIVGV